MSLILILLMEENVDIMIFFPFLFLLLWIYDKTDFFRSIILLHGFVRNRWKFFLRLSFTEFLSCEMSLRRAWIWILKALMSIHVHMSFSKWFFIIFYKENWDKVFLFFITFISLKFWVLKTTRNVIGDRLNSNFWNIHFLKLYAFLHLI